MSNIDFQNGFISGMATKGLTRSGEYYKPRIWNDRGIYDYFYIDFKGALSDFSLGMFLESIIVYDSEQINIKNIEYVSSGVYKVHCEDFSNKMNGVTVINKKSTLLTFAIGRIVPAFSVIFYVEGIANYTKKAYTYEKAKFSLSNYTILEPVKITYSAYIDEVEIIETVIYEGITYVALDNVNISYWSL